MSSRFSRFWPFGKKEVPGPEPMKDVVVRACTDPVQSTVKFQWNIHKFSYMYPDPATYDMFRNLLFKKLESPSFGVGGEGPNSVLTRWHVQLICDDEPSITAAHYIELSLKLEESGRGVVNGGRVGEGDGQTSPPPNLNPSPQFAVRSKFHLVNEEEQILHTEAMSKTMSAHRSKCGFLGFTTLETLWQRRESFFPDDILRIRVELTVISEAVSASDGSFLPPLRIDKLGVDLANLLTSKNLADVTILCQSKSFSAHKQILAARCTFFEKMFASNMVESLEPHRVEIVDMEPEILSSLIHYLYTDCLDFPCSDIRKLSSLTGAADKYGLEALKDYCFQVLLLQINLGNAGSLAVLAYFYNASPSVLVQARGFCQLNWSALANDNEFRKLTEEYPAAFLRSL